MVTVKISLPPDDRLFDTLHPKTDFDRHELALWLTNLLPSMCKDVSQIKLAKMFCR